MPTYEYKCPECKDVVELFHSIDYMLPTALMCNKDDCDGVMEKGFGGGTAIHFKGSGFYETDYKNK